VADFRDPWSHNYRLTRSSIFRGAERRLERRVVSSVAALTTVSPGFRDLLVSLHAKPTFIVPNGFDEEPTPALRVGSGHDARAVFTYTGLLYDTSAVPLLFEAIDRLVDSGRTCARRAVVQFYGRNQAVALDALRRYPRVRPLVELHGEVSHDQALAAQQAATALLLLEPPEGWALSLTPAKLFEYVVAGRPIIATGMPGGEVDRLLRDTRTGTLVSTAEALADLLAMTAGRRHRGEALVPDADRSVIAILEATGDGTPRRCARWCRADVHGAPLPARDRSGRPAMAGKAADEAADQARGGHRRQRQQLRHPVGIDLGPWPLHRASTHRATCSADCVGPRPSTRKPKSRAIASWNSVTVRTGSTVVTATPTPRGRPAAPRRSRPARTSSPNTPRPSGCRACRRSTRRSRGAPVAGLRSGAGRPARRSRCRSR
jgi:hypothetical protein